MCRHGSQGLSLNFTFIINLPAKVGINCTIFNYLNKMSASHDQPRPGIRALKRGGTNEKGIVEETLLGLKKEREKNEHEEIAFENGEKEGKKN
ncbi:hypothetical protein Bpfe_026832 [Biomphalaria pfeifferi]|uniref:Uncharacterized protein n=1 Tax=Biomphalaria pfeifferi TaxID=112525 RepID=A0AAD8AXT0_BIOPF|nr:hypothetical protein Bpfe_026832 [Biomphalaria pfeifferi]